ncbi:MAG: hypothetical protein A2Y33_07665 [Spirochaetes bacterium GWF1_51_8]|nr:MAG: hypothetical protein A2Y33_07665 [Spirochaetes bacterium GWF1_51_8]
MQKRWTYRKTSGEYETISAMIESVFKSSIAPLYPPEGVSFFLDYIKPDKLSARRAGGNISYLAVDHTENKPVGFIEGRTPSHICLLFVDESCRKQGIAKTLVSHLIRHFWDKDPNLKAITVHASPNAVEAYAAMGFVPDGKESVENGIRYLPMKKKLTK